MSLDPTRQCPYCGSECTAEFTDVGVGSGMQTGPYACDRCHAVEIGSYDEQRGMLPPTDEEREKGWYAPEKCSHGYRIDEWCNICNNGYEPEQENLGMTKIQRDAIKNDPDLQSLKGSVQKGKSRCANTRG